ncbi:MAG: hypothetical protein JKX85_11225 [Phycisphaeraceae bacterium]|nr:hypothetical protein [Phycisphaeraceae bacterium]
MNQSDTTEFPHAIWIFPTGLILLFMGIWMGTHEGFSPDFSRYAPDQLQAISVLPTARFWGVIYQLIQNLPMLGLFWGSALGYGLVMTDLVLKHKKSSLRLAAGLGVAFLMWGNWVLSALGMMSSVMAWGLVGLGIVLCLMMLFLRQRSGIQVSKKLTPSSGAWLLICPMIGLALVACICPPGTLWKVEAFGYDVTSYHLQLPKEWLAIGQLRGLNHNVYSYFPSLMESTFMFLGYLMGSVYRAIYLCQLLHFSLAILAAIQLAKIAGQWVKPFAANLAGVCLLAIPWTLIAGSMAYNEMAVMALGTTALLLLFDDTINAKSAVIFAGITLGIATFIKLTAGPMLALPLAVMVICKGNSQTDRRHWHVVLLVLASGLTLSPYLIRNVSQTGNPVFPFATSLLGQGHWSDSDVQRWNKGHHNDKPIAQRFNALGWQWLCNQGYAAEGGKKRVRLPGKIESQNIARFDYEWGLSAWWVLALLGGVGLCFAKPYRKLGFLLFGILFIQLVFWITMTHLQARFLIWSLIPGSLMLSVGFGRFDKTLTLRWLHRAVLICLVILGSSVSMKIMFSQTAAGWPIWQYVDSMFPEDDLDKIELGQAMSGDHLVNHLPRGSKVYFVADASRMLFVRKSAVYHSAFDTAPLGQWIRQANGDPKQTTALLKAQGITHLYVHWSELARLHATYGYDANVTELFLNELTQSWGKAFDMPNVMTLYIVP